MELGESGHFRREGIFRRHAIRFSEVCHRRVAPGNRDIRWFSQSEDFEGGAIRFFEVCHKQCDSGLRDIK